jgi:hypothetical protein
MKRFSFLDFDLLNLSGLEKGNSYWADVLLHCALPNVNSTSARRHRFGIVSWLPWLALQCFKSHAFDIERSGHCTVYACSLSTSAHEGTLTPVLKNLARNDRTHVIGIFSQSEKPVEGIHLAEPVCTFYALSLPQSFASGVKVFFLTLMHSLQIALQLLKMGEIELLLNIRWSWFDEKLALYYFCKERLKQYNVDRQPLILTYELLPEIKALVMHFRHGDSRVIHIMHGQRLPTYQITMATDLVLLSKIDEPWFRARVDPSVKLWAIGHPRLEDVRRQVGLPRDKTTDLPRITFFSQPAEGDYSRSQRIADWQICSSLLGKAEVRFRAHPREDRAILATDMKAAGIDFMQISEAGLIEDLKWCDAVASSWSTVSMEAAACGRGIFWTCSTPGKYEASQQLRDHGIGVLIQNSPDWAPYFRQWSEGGWKSPVTVSDEQLRELGMIGDTSKSWMERLEIEVATLSPKIEG